LYGATQIVKTASLGPKVPSSRHVDRRNNLRRAPFSNQGEAMGARRLRSTRARRCSLGVLAAASLALALGGCRASEGGRLGVAAAPGRTTGALAGSSFVPAGYGCVWHDEFGGEQGAGEARANLDSTSWSFQEINVNGELQAYTTRQCLTSPSNWNTCVEDGRLRIQGRHESIVCDANNDGVVENPDCAPHYTEPFHQSANYTSGRLMTKHKVHFADGYLEFRVKLPEADRAGAPESGMWPAVWMLGESISQGPAPGSTGWPACGEIDVMEWATNGGVSHQGWNAIWAGPGGTNACSSWPQGGNAACGPCAPVGGECVGEVTNGARYEMTGWTGFDHHQWHTYGFKWENAGNNATDQMTYFIDGVRMGVLHLGAEQAAFKSDMFLTVNLALGGALGGTIAVTDWSNAYLDVDYMRWYRQGQADACGLADGSRPPLHWRGGLTGCPSGSLFSSPSCWSTASGGAATGAAPGAKDAAIFDGGGPGDCALDPSAPTQAASLTTTSGYAGAITQGAQDVSLSGDLTLGGGTFTGRAGRTIATNQGGAYYGGLVVSGGAFDGNGATIAVQSLRVTGGTFTAGAGGFSTNNGGQASFSGGSSAFSSGTSSFAGALTTSGAGTTVTFGAGAAAVTGRATFNGGTVTFGPGTLTLNGGLDVEGAAVTLGAAGATATVMGAATVGAGTLSTSLSTTTFAGAFTMSGGGAFNGGLGTTTFAAAPTLTSGTFTVGAAGSTGGVIFSSGATFASGMTLAFPTTGGTLSAPGGQTIAVNGAVTSRAGGAGTPPRIARSSGPAGVTISFGSTSVLDLDGLELDNSVAGGVTIADGATYALFARLSFKNNVANSTSSGATHLAITSSNPGGAKVIVASGCSFDATAQINVTLSGVGGSPGVRAIFEDQGRNGARAGESYDLDADANDDNVADGATAPRYGSVVEWTYASPADTAGTPTGPPAPAFDWNTFTFYGVYVAFKNTGGAGTSDRFWLRNTDGTAAYSFDLPDSSGDLVGTPRWDAVDETVAGLDVNGDGDAADTDVRVVYLGTSAGRIIKLIDTGTSFVRPAGGRWATDFSDASVSTITSPLIADGTNIYFGGTGGGATKIFGVQVGGGVNEKTLQKDISTAGTGAITTAPAWGSSGGATYLFIGTAAAAGQAYLYRVQVSPGATIDASYTGSTTNVNDGVNVINNRVFAVTQGGKLFVLDAFNFGVGGFTTRAGFPYASSPSKPIAASAYLDPFTNTAYFGDAAGRLFVVTDTGASLSASYPYQLAGASTVMGTPLYLSGSGTIAIGASDGYVYFVNRRDATGTPALRKRFFAGSGAVTAISYDVSAARYMAASSDGHLTFISAADVGADADGLE
jgi:beta-glucanase (GH16 family)